MIHALDRAKERYGLDLTQRDIEALAKEIHAGRSVLLAKLTMGRERHIVQCQGVSAIVVYATTTAKVVTFLPKDAPYPTRCLSRRQRRKAKRRRLAPAAR